MGYKKFGGVGKDYKVGRLFFSSCPNSLVFYLFGCFD